MVFQSQDKITTQAIKHVMGATANVQFISRTDKGTTVFALYVAESGATYVCGPAISRTQTL